MISSWKRRVSRGVLPLLFATALFGVALLSPFRPAAAAATCAAATSEAGGSHKRCVSPNGVFHVWTPPGYDANRAGRTVIYAHGFSDQCLNLNPYFNGDGVGDWYATPGAVYVDGVWKDHKLSDQFAAGGLPNSIFIAVQAQTCGTTTGAHDPAHVDTTTHWSSFSSLLGDLSSASIKRPIGPIVLMGHSAGYKPLNLWLSHSEVEHIVFLDTMYNNAAADNFINWLKDKKHTASIIQADSDPSPTTGSKTRTQQVVDAISDVVKVPGAPVGLSALPENGKKARVLSMTWNEPKASSHMDVVTKQVVIPMFLQRVPLAGQAVSAPAPTPPTPGGTTGTSVPVPTAPDPKELRPFLEIPIPNLNFTGIIRENGNITIPWIAQYIGGVYTFLLSIAGLMAAVMMVIGGFQYVTSAGDKGRLSAGKKKIVDALTGLVLALSSYVILFTINPDLVAFNGLQLLGVQTVPLAEYADGASVPPPPKPGDPVLPAGTPPPPPAPGSNQRTCNSVATCLPYCRAANCTKVLCYKGDANCPPTDLAGFEGVSLSGVTAPTSSDCVQSKFPNIPPGAPVTNITWDGIHNIKANGQRASQLVIDGLKRAEKYIDDNYPGQNLTISLSNCFRDTRLDFAWQCTEIMRPPPKNNPEGWGSTWPGSNPHSSGYACDLALLRAGKIISGNIANQNCTSKIPGNQLLVDILTNATVGGRRLGYEAWHFNWGGFNSCYCAGTQCPTTPIIGDCKGNHENTKC